MQIGFSINEILFLATLLTGALWVAWKLKTRRLNVQRLNMRRVHMQCAQADDQRRPASEREEETSGGRALYREPEKKPLWVSFGADLFIVVALMFTCRVAVADWPKVPSGSMEPTLRVGDYLLVNHLAYGPRLPFTNTAIEFGRPQRGDVVVFRYPLDVSQFYVKRLVGMPGDEVRFQDGAVSVNGATIDVQMLGDGSGAGVPPEDMGHWTLRETAAGHSRTVKVNPFLQGRLPVDGLGAACSAARAGTWTCRVPIGHYLMLGDNRDNSADSRAWGFLPHEQVYGKAVRVLFNLHDLSRSWTAL